MLLAAGEYEGFTAHCMGNWVSRGDWMVKNSVHFGGRGGRKQGMGDDKDDVG